MDIVRPGDGVRADNGSVGGWEARYSGGHWSASVIKTCSRSSGTSAKYSNA